MNKDIVEYKIGIYRNTIFEKYATREKYFYYLKLGCKYLTLVIGGR